MALYNVTIRSDVEFNIEVKAENEEKAREIAMRKWDNCDISEMEFWNSHIEDIYEE